MKVIQLLSAATLSLLLGIGTSAYAQERHEQQAGGEHEQQGRGHQQQGQPSQGERHRERDRVQPQHPGRASQQQQHAGGQQSREQNRQPEHSAQRAQQRQGDDHAARRPEGRRIEQTAWRQHRAQSWRTEHRTWQQRGGYDGYRIPADHFRSYFGPLHGFRIFGLPHLVVNGYPRFQYRSYWFSPVDPWPESWATNWYDTDDVYINCVDNGYYLYNRRYPAAGMAINISL